MDAKLKDRESNKISPWTQKKEEKVTKLEEDKMKA